SGRARSSALAGPPTMNVRPPETAPPTPPETGASSISRPRSAAAAATLREVSASMVELSINSVPSGAAAMTPPSPRYKSWTWLPAGNMEIMTSAWATASAALEATCAPCSCASSSCSLTRSNTTSCSPAWSRLAAIGPPMLPSPMNAIVPAIVSSCYCSSQIGQRAFVIVRGQAERLGDVLHGDVVGPCRRPGRLLVLVHQQRADAFGKIGVARALHGDGEFALKRLCQRQMRADVPLLEGDDHGGRRGARHGFGRALQPFVIAVFLRERGLYAGHVGGIGDAGNH